MKIVIENIGPQQEEEIIIRCFDVTEEVLCLVNQLKTKSNFLIGYEKEIIYQLNQSSIYYFESLDNKVFIYGKDKFYESKQKLYELEVICDPKKFFRASKSIIINFTKISHVRPSISGRFEAMMDNGEKVMVSRQYVPVLRSKLGL